jgi:hypothetical protein
MYNTLNPEPVEDTFITIPLEEYIKLEEKIDDLQKELKKIRSELRFTSRKKRKSDA